MHNRKVRTLFGRLFILNKLMAMGRVKR